MFSDSSPVGLFERRVQALCLLAAPVLMSLTTFFWQADDTALGVMGATVSVLAFVCWIPAWHALYGLVRPHHPRLAAIGPVLAAYASVVLVNWSVLGLFVEVQGIGPVHEVLQQLGQDLGFAGFVLLFSGFLFPLQFPVLAVALRRGRAIPAWILVSFVVGGLAFPPSRMLEIRALAHIADLVLLLPMGWLAYRWWSTPAQPRLEN